MKKLLILGAGTAGTIMANKMRKKLSWKDWNITVVDKEKNHYYQPGFLFVPFGYYQKKDIVKPVVKFIPDGVELINSEIDKIDASGNRVTLKNGISIAYDILIVATGTRISPEDTPGLKGEQWQKSVFDFYTLEGAEALAVFFKNWKGGNLVINIADNPVKCPVAPLEFAFYADEYFTRKGIRDKVNITYVTPMSGAFTKPKASKIFGSFLERKKINLISDFFLGEVDNSNKKIVDFGGKEVPFDCLVSIPLHIGDPVITKSGLGDEFGFVKADKNTLQSVLHKNIFVIGDAGNFPSSKAGSVAHFQADVLMKNILSFIQDKPLIASFDGHSNCYIETGFGKGILIDFNYITEPLPGFYPLPLVGPFSLLKETRLNHIGKLLFKWIYWNILIRGRKLPVTDHMSMTGKNLIK
ncbi:MAG: NAD(P)/FAD-dependent oxidoreductase [Bacteroidetes bacterium]|nr:MAG: NAD(P)/FAD-dependent oxidoreductase [Bacteroidota bacterium]